MPQSPCNKHQFFAHLQVDLLDNRDAGKGWTDGVQKSHVYCTRSPAIKKTQLAGRWLMPKSPVQQTSVSCTRPS
jgi:hypothetical protein